MHAKTRVGFDGRWYRTSGVGIYIRELLRGLGRTAPDLEVVLYENPANPIPKLDAPNIDRVVLPSPTFSLREQIEVPRRCLRDRLDVFHAPFTHFPMLVPCPVVTTIHDLTFFRLKIFDLRDAMRLKVRYRIAAKRAKMIIVPSANTAGDVLKILGVPQKRIRVIPEAADANIFQPPLDHGGATHLYETYGIVQPYVLILSARNWQAKNLSTALSALLLARQNGAPEFYTVVAGHPEGFKRALQEGPYHELRATVTGYVPDEDLALLYQNAAVFLQPSTYEGFGLPLLEAMSCGCAVVCSRGGSQAEVAGDGAVIVDPEDIAAVAAAFVPLLADGERRAALKARALKRASEFSWDEAARKTADAYREVAGAQARRVGILAPPAGNARSER